MYFFITITSVWHSVHMFCRPIFHRRIAVFVFFVGVVELITGLFLGYICDISERFFFECCWQLKIAGCGTKYLTPRTKECRTPRINKRCILYSRRLKISTPSYPNMVNSAAFFIVPFVKWKHLITYTRMYMSFGQIC